MPKDTFLMFSRVLLLGLLALSCNADRSNINYRVGFSQCCDDPWRDMMEQEMYRELAFHPEIKFKIRIANNSSEQQIAQIRELVASGIDLLIVSPNESKPLTSLLNEVFNSGIPVLLIDRKIDSDQYTAYIGADNYEIGQTAARYIASQTIQGKIIELQLGMTMTPAEERSQGFSHTLSQYPRFSIVAQVEMDGGLEKLKTDFISTLHQHPDADIIFAHNDFLAENAFKWSKEAGFGTDKLFVGIDGIPGMGKGIQAVEDGTLNASLLYPTGGAEAIRLALTVMNNLPFDKNNLLQTIVINKDNARILHLQMKKVESLQHTIDKQLKSVDDLSIIYRNQRVYIFILVFTLLIAALLGGILLKSLRAKQVMNNNLQIKTREAQEHEQQILSMSEELTAATHAKVDFFTNISHEFRTPLTLILGYLEGLLSRETNPNESVQHLHMVRKNALRLLRLVNQLMDFRKIESGKMTVRANENDLVDFVHGIVEAYRQMAEKNGIQLDFFSVEKPLFVWFDINMLDKVMFNLLSNAFKFTPKGGSIQVTIFLHSILDTAIIKVEDSGSGMSKEEMTHAFDQFYQGTSNTYKGTGLGLSLSKELISLHSGTIELWSEHGKGTRFEISLPLGKAHFRTDQLIRQVTSENAFSDEQQALLEYENTAVPAVLPTEKTGDKNLLIIEDNDELRQFLINHFGKIYHIWEASDGNSGLDIAIEEVPDLIIADIMMPGRDGLTLTKMLKNDLRTSHIPVVLLTARNTIDQKIEGIQTGADAYVTKPFNLVFLTEIIKNLLQSRQNLRTTFSGNLKPDKLPAEIGYLDRQFLEKFIPFIETNFIDQNLTVERLSTEFGLSRVQLFRKTKVLLGDSPNNIIQQIRLKKAAQLLLSSQLSVSEIAYQTGYSSPGYFATAFKGKYDCSPSEWRERSM